MISELGTAQPNLDNRVNSVDQIAPSVLFFASDFRLSSLASKMSPKSCPQ